MSVILYGKLKPAILNMGTTDKTQPLKNMKVNESDFFRQATIRICGQLQIEKAMVETVKYIKKYIPVDVMYLELMLRDAGMIKIIARATAEEGKKIDIAMQLPPEITDDVLEHTAKAEKQPEVMIVNRPELDPMTSALLKIIGEPYSSVMGLPLVMENKPLGGVVIIAEGKDRYNNEHERLFALLKEPFYIALSNTLEHQEVITLKDRLEDDNRYLHHEMYRSSGEHIVGRDFGLKNAMNMVRQVASHESPVLLLGETGVGKDIVANAIHYSSKRREGPLITVNCGAIPETLIDSELFGHEKGAFTGALTKKRGRFERADKGTIFLDEVGELPPQAQVRLLRVLQNKEIERVGGEKAIPVNIRVMAATNKNLEEMIRLGQFREDLWFRLNVFPITIPPLRERKHDIPALIHHFLEKKSKTLKLRETPRMSQGAMDKLKDYHWPGNVRELENIVERELILNPQGPLTFLSIQQNREYATPSSFLDQGGSIPNFDELVTEYFKKILKITNGKINGSEGASELTGINANTLRNKMKKLNITFGRKL
jgi:transcriptional regulator with GAF, ATPase, and Fis domain